MPSPHTVEGRTRLLKRAAKNAAYQSHHKGGMTNSRSVLFQPAKLSADQEATLSFLHWYVEPICLMLKHAESIIENGKTFLAGNFEAAFKDFVRLHADYLSENSDALLRFFEAVRQRAIAPSHRHDEGNKVVSIQRYQKFESNCRESLRLSVEGFRFRLKDFIRMAEEVDAMNEQRVVPPPAMR